MNLVGAEASRSDPTDDGPLPPLNLGKKHPPRPAIPRGPDPGVEKWVSWGIGKVDVAGVGFRREAAEDALEKLQVGDFIELRRDPSNPHDHNAIEVRVYGRKVGFIPRERAAALNSRYHRQMPIHAEYHSCWFGDTGYIRFTIYPKMPSKKERVRSGWNLQET